jgi:hypothetical protein
MKEEEDERNYSLLILELCDFVVPLKGELTWWKQEKMLGW